MEDSYLLHSGVDVGLEEEDAQNEEDFRIEWIFV